VPRAVAKRHTTAACAFDAPAAARAGSVRDGRVQFNSASSADRVAGRFSRAVATLPRVDLLVTYQGAGGDAISSAVESGARGIVVASAGAGSLTPGQAVAARRLADAGIPLVVASRTGGPVPRESLPAGLDAIAAGDLSPVKARLLLMLGLAAHLSPRELRQLFERPAVQPGPARSKR